jgi:hypothetical protein
MKYTDNQIETLELLKHTVFNGDIVKGIINRSCPIDEKTLNDILDFELNKAIENTQGFILEIMTHKHDDKLEVMQQNIYKQLTE